MPVPRTHRFQLAWALLPRIRRFEPPAHAPRLSHDGRAGTSVRTGWCRGGRTGPSRRCRGSRQGPPSRDAPPRTPPGHRLPGAGPQRAPAADVHRRRGPAATRRCPDPPSASPHHRGRPYAPAASRRATRPRPNHRSPGARPPRRHSPGERFPTRHSTAVPRPSHRFRGGRHDHGCRRTDSRHPSPASHRHQRPGARKVHGCAPNAGHVHWPNARAGPRRPRRARHRGARRRRRRSGNGRHPAHPGACRARRSPATRRSLQQEAARRRCRCPDRPCRRHGRCR